MEKLAVILALNGMLVLLLAMLAGLMLYLAIRGEREQAAWHLLHAGGTGRGVMLLALAALLEYPELPFAWLQASAWAVLLFVWTSMAAMGIRALSGERGLGLEGTVLNRLVYLLYAVGTVAIFPAFAILIYGFVGALNGAWLS